MAKYLVTVTRNTTESTIVDVEAADANEANIRAIEEARNNPSAFNWVADEGNFAEPYLPDPDSTARDIIECPYCDTGHEWAEDADHIEVCRYCGEERGENR